MKQLVTFIIATVFFTGTALAQNVGQTAPDFMLKSLNNNDYTLSASRGKVVLVFLVGYNCPLCIASAPTVQSDLVNTFKNNKNFEFLIIDTWNGSQASFTSFKNRTGLEGIYLLQGGSVATNWSTTYDRLAVVDSEGKLVFKGTRAARSDVNEAKSAVQSALQNITTSIIGKEENTAVVLKQNFPNPVQNKTTIEFSLANPGFVTLSVSNLAGKIVKTLVNTELQSGIHSVELDAGELPNGIYFYRLNAGNFSSTQKMIVNK